MQGLMPDVLSADQLGRGSAFKTVLDMIGLVVASLFVGRMLPPNSAVITGPVGMVVAVLIVSAGITLVSTRERSSHSEDAPEPRPNPLKEILQFDFRRHTSFTWLIASRLAFLLGVYGIQSFAQYYVRDTLSDANPIKLTGDLMALIVLGLVFFSMIAGVLCDRFGTRPVHAAAAVLVSTGSLAMLLAYTPGTVLACGLVIGSGIGLFLTANWTLSNQLAPAAEAGKYLGLTNLATAGAGALSRLFGPVIDLVNLSAPGRYLGYSVLFVLSAVFAIAGFAIMGHVYRPRGSQPEPEMM
jgi:MFS family permease